MKKIILIIGLVFSVIGCDDTLTVQNVDDKVIPDSNVSFAEHIYPVFQVKCSFSGCHSSSNPADGIDLSTWAGVTADPNIVFPGEPDLSRLVWSIEGNKPPIQPMPPVGFARPVTPNQLQGIKIWINEGAQNN